MKRFMILAAVGLALAAPTAIAETGKAMAPGEVTAVSVLPGAGRTHVIIDVQGTFTIQDFVLDSPARLVIDLVGAKLNVPGSLYDGNARGGVLDIRYAQHRPDVVRVVIELESIRDYQLEHADDAVRISFGSDRSFDAWSSAVAARWTAANSERPATQPASAFAPSASTPLLQSQQPPVTVTYDSAHIRDVANAFAEYSGKSIIIGKDIDLVVSATIKNQPWDVAFRTILDAHGLTGTEDPPGVIRVDSRESLAARDSTEPLVTKVLPINYARAAPLAAVMGSVVSARGNVVADTFTNSLLVTDVQSRIRDDSILVSQLDVRTPQVSIQAKLIFVDRTNLQSLGLRYDLGTADQFFNRLIQRPDPGSAEGIDIDNDGANDFVSYEPYDPEMTIVDLGGNALSGVANAEAEILSPALELIFSTAIGNFDVTTFLTALQQVDLADLQAEPLTTTADNTEAYILVGERTPIRVVDLSTPTGGAGQQAARATTEIIPTGLQLKVTPHVTANRQILMAVRVENSSVQEAAGDLGFTFQTQEVESEILVDDGQTAVIGGLTVSQVTVSKSGIPLLVDLPVLGGLFGFSEKRERRRDLLVMVTPHILDPGL